MDDSAVADRLQVSPAGVSGYNLSEHGNSQFVAWSQVQPVITIRSLLSEELDVDTMSPCAATRFSLANSIPILGLQQLTWQKL